MEEGNASNRLGNMLKIIKSLLSEESKMKCFCEQQETYRLKIEGDVGADPIWCNQCGGKE